MRISTSMIYNTNLGHMQTSLNNYMETNIQGGTQKKINKPSDDPAGAALVLNSRAEIQSTVQYQTNTDTARGWLELTDATLQNVSATLAEIKVLAEQAATGTLTEENREQVSIQLEQLFGQLLNLSNMEFEGNSLFGGHNYTDNAYEQGLAVQTYDENFDTTGTTVTGKADSSMSVRFTTGGVVGTDAMDYQWTEDGGLNWQTGTLAAGETQLKLNGVEVNMRAGTEITAVADPSTENVDSKDGTFLMLYPTAVYNGDDNDASAYGVVQNGLPGMTTDVHANIEENVLMKVPAGTDLNAPGATINYEYSVDGGANWLTASTTVPNPATKVLQLPFNNADGEAGFIEINTEKSPVGPIANEMTIDMQPRRVDMLNGPTDVMLNAEGIFTQNVVVRLDAEADLAAPGSDVKYSYSNDGGTTWISSVAQVPNPSTGAATLTIPGGFLELSSTDGGTSVLAANTQMTVHPDRASLSYEVMENTYVPVNQVGKDIFGGMYNGQVVEGDNIFEAVGQLIGFCQNNEQDGIGESLVTITAALEGMLTHEAEVGGLINRLDLAESMLASEKLDQESRLSYTEDIDLTELLNQLAKDELAYSTVLKSASMIMQTNLTKYL